MEVKPEESTSNAAMFILPMIQFIMILGIFTTPLFTHAQNPLRFEEDVAGLVARNAENAVESPIIFVGSSSFRMWKTVAEDLRDSRVINNGFGGSQFSDLIYYMEELVFDTEPKAIFIYEGDNDLGTGKSLETTMRDTKIAFQMIRKRLPDVPVHFVSPKPSIVRADKREQYIAYNRWLEYWVQDKANTSFVDVWNPMMLADGTLDESLFIEDGLHMNAKGYAIWSDQLRPLLKAIE